jgi:hypothetical protein
MAMPSAKSAKSANGARIEHGRRGHDIRLATSSMAPIGKAA